MSGGRATRNGASDRTGSGTTGIPLNGCGRHRRSTQATASDSRPMRRVRLLGLLAAVVGLIVTATALAAERASEGQRVLPVLRHHKAHSLPSLLPCRPVADVLQVVLLAHSLCTERISSGRIKIKKDGTFSFSGSVYLPPRYTRKVKLTVSGRFPSWTTARLTVRYTVGNARPEERQLHRATPSLEVDGGLGGADRQGGDSGRTTDDPYVRWTRRVGWTAGVVVGCRGGDCRSVLVDNNGKVTVGAKTLNVASLPFTFRYPASSRRRPTRA